MQLDEPTQPDDVLEENGPRGTAAPVVNDAQQLVFDWPSEEIKQACENMFPRGDEDELPVLNWIPEEIQREKLGIGNV
jgi:hypothetical protein